MAKDETQKKDKSFIKDLRETVKKISNRKRFKSPMERQRKVDKLKADAAKTGGGAFTMDEMRPLKTLTSEGPGEVKNTPKGLKSGGRAGYKSGSKGCKLAMKGKGRAYGKNS